MDVDSHGTKRAATEIPVRITKRQAGEGESPPAEDEFQLHINHLYSGPAGTSHFFGAGSVGAPGVQQYPEWKPPDAITKKYSKTFLIEVHNKNFRIVGGVVPDSSQPDIHLGQCYTPYSHFTWWYIFWYLSLGEYNWLCNNSNFARIKNTRFQINVVGHRLPFTTNDENSSVANSQCDQMLDLFKGFEKLFPFRTVDAEDKVVTNESQILPLAQRLYGLKSIADEAEDTQIPATLGYRRYPHTAMFEKREEPDPITTLSGWPAFVQHRYLSADLRTFRGPLFEVAYKTKNGILHQARSIVDDGLTGVLDSQLRNIHTSHAIWYSRLNSWTSGGGTGLDRQFTTEKVMLYPEKAVTADTVRLHSMPSRYNQTNTYQQGYMKDIEGQAFSERNNLAVTNFESILLGVRPQMNGATNFQKGILQLEIKTECEVEYQHYHPNPTPVPTNMLDFEKYTNITCDIDTIHYIPYNRIPNYTAGGKLNFRVGAYPAL